MSFVNLEQIKPFIHKGFFDKLNAEFSAANPPISAVKYFDKIVTEIDSFVNSLTDITIPSDTTQTPSGFLFPIAKIFEYYLITHFTELAPENRERILRDFNEAKETLKNNKYTSETELQDKSRSFTSNFLNLYEW